MKEGEAKRAGKKAERKKVPNKTNKEPSEEYNRFEEFAAKLMQVSKEEIDEEEKKREVKVAKDQKSS